MVIKVVRVCSGLNGHQYQLGGKSTISYREQYIIRQVCGQTLAKVRVSGHRTVVILLVYNRGRTCNLEVM